MKVIITDNVKEEIFDSAKNMWLSELFENISGRLPNISFKNQKEIFFALVEEALDKGMIKFDYPPLEEYADKEGLWDADNVTIMKYLKDGFPKNAIHENDIEVNNYFYDIAPPANWC